MSWGRDRIYFITDGTAVKIGWTNRKPERRLIALQLGNPRDLEIIATVDGDRDDEQWLHSFLSEFHLRGEWFDLRKSRVADLVNKARDLSSEEFWRIVDHKPRQGQELVARYQRKGPSPRRPGEDRVQIAREAGPYALKAARIATQLTWEELGRSLGTSARAVRSWEHPKSRFNPIRLAVNHEFFCAFNVCHAERMRELARASGNPSLAELASDAHVERAIARYNECCAQIDAEAKGAA